MNNPVFVVTGAPNKGKSTFVKAMTNDPEVVVKEKARTTFKSKSYTFGLINENEGPLMTIWDTPGFENSAKVYEIITELIDKSGNNIEAFKKFIADYEGISDYHYEVEIFKPMIDFACVVYIADCSKSFSKEEFLREIQLIKLTQLPRIAILNPIDGDRHFESWRKGLRDYFNNIKVFNPHNTTFEEKLSTLSAFSHLYDEWEKPINELINHLKNERAFVLEESAKIIRKTILKVYDKEFKIKIDPLKDEKDLKQDLLSKIRKFVNQTMNESQSELIKRFGLDLDIEMKLNYKDNDLFDNTVRAVNVSPHQRAIAYAISAASTGVVIDLIAGGLTFGIFTLSLGVGGYVTGYYSNLNPIDLLDFKSVKNHKDIKYLKIQHLKNEVGLLIINRLRQIVSNLYNRTIVNTEKLIIDKDLPRNESKKLVGLVELIARDPEQRYLEKNKKELLQIIHEILIKDQKNI